jgi:protein SCO1/2
MSVPDKSIFLTKKSERGSVSVWLIFLFIVILAILTGSYLVTQQPKAVQSSSNYSVLQEQLDAQGAFAFPKPITVSDVTFLNEEGETVHKDNFLGKWSLLFFGYTFCPDICPTTLAVMQQMWTQLTPELQEKTQIVFVSVDIERDTPEQMKTYMDYFNPKFTALTGNAESLNSLAGQLNAVYAKVERHNENGEIDPELGYLMDHSANISILDPNGNYYGFIKPPFSPKKMLKIVSTIEN